jgi:hypothetical protein
LKELYEKKEGVEIWAQFIICSVIEELRENVGRTGRSQITWIRVAF